MKSCPYCNAPLQSDVYPRTVCPSCGKELHSCRCCRFFHPGSHHDCLEAVDELVIEKDRSNFCESFCLADIKLETQESREDKRQKDKAAFDALFNL